jgi:NAD+ diphosphatase
MSKDYQPHFKAPAAHNGAALWFAFHEGRVLVRMDDATPAVMTCTHPSQHGLQILQEHYLGTYGGEHCYAAELAAAQTAQTLPEGHTMLGLRDLLGHIDDTLAGISGRAFQILEWNRNHKYCGRCGGETVPRSDERARTCPACKRTSYPPVAPVIMILITHGRKMLLARKVGWGNTRYSALAGFVEPGETLESTVIRETREEVGVEIKNIKYFGSQPWPFPNNLMIAFTAEYAGNPIKPDGVEIEHAEFFDADELPNLPPGISISRRMINTIGAELRKMPKDQA